MLILSFFACNTIFGQDFYQDLKGQVTDKTTSGAIENVQVILLSNNKAIDQTLTNLDGSFSFEKIEVGSYDLSFSHIGYVAHTKTAISVNSSRSSFVQIRLEASIYELDEFVVKPLKERGQATNEMALVSAISINAKDTRKLAGGLDDPVRTAANFAGVTSNGSFSDNFISIRGNSARSLKYQMEGLILPNPTHFSRIGSSGGTFTIFSIQLLDDSDFFTGAFPAEYANVVGGVMDVKFRKGNRENHEFSIAAGTLGLDFTAEGPMNKETGSSYLVNYRFATVGLARFIGYPTRPTYQDLSFNLNFPLSNNDNLKVFGIVGNSDRLREAETDTSLWVENLDRFQLALNSGVATMGVSYSRLMRNDKTLFKASLMAAATQETDDKDYILDNGDFVNRERNQYKSLPAGLSVSLKNRFSKRHSNKTGISLYTKNHDYYISRYDLFEDKQNVLVDLEGSSSNVNVYSQSKIDLNNKLTAIAGLNLSYFSVNNNFSIEPRLSFRYRQSESNVFALAFGRHSQEEEFAVYKYADDENGMPNENLELLVSDHIVASWSTVITTNHRLKLEAYYQRLSHVPVSINGTFSTVNLEELDELRALNNEGSARNYGLDLAFERITDKGFYYIINGSLINSFYTAADGIERSTKFDYGYNLNYLMGREYLIGEKKNKRNFFGWNTAFTFTGGAPYSPVDLDQSALYQETIFDESRAFSQTDEPLFVIDFSVDFKTNKLKKRTTVWSMQLKNIFSSADALIREYNTITGAVETIPSSGFFPAISYRFEF